MDKKAYLLNDDANPAGRSRQQLYRLDPPLIEDAWCGHDERSYEYVIVSAVSVMGEPETYIFPANIDGQITDWGELPGSMKGALIHSEVLIRLGYEIVRPDDNVSDVKSRVVPATPLLES